MLDCMGEPEDAVPATIRSVIQGCGEFGVNRLKLIRVLNSAREDEANAVSAGAP